MDTQGFIGGFDTSPESFTNDFLHQLFELHQNMFEFGNEISGITLHLPAYAYDALTETLPNKHRDGCYLVYANHIEIKGDFGDFTIFRK